MKMNIENMTKASMVLIFMAITTTMVIIPSCFMFPSGQTEEEEYTRVETNPDGKGLSLEIEFRKGKSHYYPLMAIWTEDTTGNYLQTLFVAEAIATGIFGHGDASTGKWMPGEIRRPAALPYWGHQRGIRAEDGLFLPSTANPLPDAFTGATPTGSFFLETRTDKQPDDPFLIFFEINQSWDWNRYWTNNRFPDDEEYRSSAQPALVYSTLIDPSDLAEEYILEPVGRSHHSGASGQLFEDLHTMTTALNIAEKIIVRVRQ